MGIGTVQDCMWIFGATGGEDSMKYYKYIDLPGWELVAQQCLDYVENKTNILDTNNFWNDLNPVRDQKLFDLIGQLVDSAGVSVEGIAVLVADARGTPIHQDSPKNSSHPKARINIPLKNCEDSDTHFYQAINWNPVELIHNNGIKYIYHTAENCQLVDTVSVTRPTIIRVDELHQVIIHNTNLPRISLTCLVTPDPINLLEE